MPNSRRSDDYASFDYLESGIDYRFYDLAAELDRVPPTIVALSEDEAARADRLAAECLMISMHDHPNRFPSDIGETPSYVKDAHIATAYEGLAHSSWHCVFDNLLDGICAIESHGGWKWGDVLHDLGMRLCDLGHQDFVVPCRGVADVHRAHREEKVAWIASLEGAAMIENAATHPISNPTR